MSKSTKRPRSYTRPGVEASTRLAETLLHNPSSIWERIEVRYTDMLNFKGGTALIDHDRYCYDLGLRLVATNDDDGNRKKGSNSSGKQKEVCITSDDLYQVVEWKFAKGKTRHALWKFLKANTEESVQSCSRRAFAQVRHPSSVSSSSNDDNDDTNTNDDIIDDEGDNIKSALNELTKLKGVGPATASAILSLYRPDLFAFMDDEIIECLYPGKRGYTLKIYLEVNDQCRTIASKLGNGWNGRRIGRTLWTASQLCCSEEEEDLTLGVDVDVDVVEGENGDNDNEEGGVVEETKPTIATKSSKRRKYNLRIGGRCP